MNWDDHERNERYRGQKEKRFDKKNMMGSGRAKKITLTEGYMKYTSTSSFC